MGPQGLKRFRVQTRNTKLETRNFALIPVVVNHYEAQSGSHPN